MGIWTGHGRSNIDNVGSAGGLLRGPGKHLRSVRIVELPLRHFVDPLFLWDVSGLLREGGVKMFTW